MSDDQLLQRITRVLEERAIPVQRPLDVVRAVGAENVYLGVSTLTERVQLLVPFQREALVAIGLATSTVMGSRLTVAAHREQLSAAVMISGAVSWREAVGDVGPPGSRDAWLSLVESLSGGSIANRMRYLTEERGTITIMYPPRTGEAETTFVRELAGIATRLGVPDSWRALYAEAGEGRADLGVTTECTSTGMAARLALRFGNTVFDRAIDLVKTLGDIDQARAAAVRMGMLAATLEIDTLRSVEAVFDRDEPDLICWVKLQSDSP